MKDFVRVEPKQKYLSPGELIEQRNATAKPPNSSQGPKRTLLEGSSEEAAELERLYANLRSQISHVLCDRSDCMSLAVWDTAERAMCLERKDGKLDSFGYTKNGKVYLHDFEALYLCELGRLQMWHNGMLMSLEKAYLLFFDEAASPRCSEYLVYAHLRRSGFILLPHRNVRFEAASQQVTRADCVWELLHSELGHRKVADYIEASPFFAGQRERRDRLISRITHAGDGGERANIEVAENDEKENDGGENDEDEEEMDEDRGMFEKEEMPEEKEMNEEKEMVGEKEMVEEEETNEETFKADSTTRRPSSSSRKLDEQSETFSPAPLYVDAHKGAAYSSRNLPAQPKKPSNEPEVSSNGSPKCSQERRHFRRLTVLDSLRSHGHVQKFEAIFRSFDVIHLRSGMEAASSSSSASSSAPPLSISFDLYLPRGPFRRSSPGPPAFRVAIVDASSGGGDDGGQTFPCHGEMLQCFQRQLYPTPVLLASVGESKQIQAFLFHVE